MTQADLTSFEAVGDKLFLKEGTKIENLITESTSDRDESKAALFNLVVDELPPEAGAEELYGESKAPKKVQFFEKLHYLPQRLKSTFLQKNSL